MFDIFWNTNQQLYQHEESQPRRWLNSSPWWYVPEWLLQDPNECPQWNIQVVEANSESVSEKRGKKHVIFEVSGTAPEIDKTKYYFFRRPLRVTSCVNRLFNHIKNKREIDKEFSASEINKAEPMWTKYTEGKHYLSNKRQFNEKQRQSQPNPKIHQDRIIRLHGRFISADLPEYVKLPILLPRQEHFSKLLIQDIYIMRFFTLEYRKPLGQLRQRYWISQGWTVVKTILKTCLICLRFQGWPYKFKSMAPWLTSKVIRSKKFTKTGLDCFWPLYMRQGKDRLKVWICLFTCITVWVIHL